MRLYTRIGVLTGVFIVSIPAFGNDESQLGATSYLNGYTAGRAFAAYYKHGNKEEFIRGILERVKRVDVVVRLDDD